MDQTMHHTVLLIEAVEEVLDQAWVSPFIEQIEPVCYKVGNLQKAILRARSKVGNIGEVVKNSPLRAELAKTPNPDLSPLVEPSFGENDQATLRIIMFVIGPG